MIDELPFTLPVGEYDYSKAEAQFLAEQVRMRAKRGARMPVAVNVTLEQVDKERVLETIEIRASDESETEFQQDRTDIRPVNAVFYFIVVAGVFVMLLFVLSLLGTLIR